MRPLAFAVLCLAFAPIPACAEEDGDATATGDVPDAAGGPEDVAPPADDVSPPDAPETGVPVEVVLPSLDTNVEPVGSPFACLSAAPELGAPTMETIPYPATLTEFTSGAPIVGADIKLCAREDVWCATPLHTLQTAEDGSFSFDLPAGRSGFDGYLEITGANTQPAMGYFDPPFVKPFDKPAKVRTLLQSNFNALALLIGVTLDETRGHFAVVAYDCAEALAAGVAVTFGGAEDGATTQVYIRDFLPSKEATETDGTGLSVLVNAAQGNHHAYGTVTATSQPYGCSESFVRPGFFTLGSLTVYAEACP